jgi:hypothetical protein
MDTNEAASWIRTERLEKSKKRNKERVEEH